MIQAHSHEAVLDIFIIAVLSGQNQEITMRKLVACYSVQMVAYDRANRFHGRPSHLPYRAIQLSNSGHASADSHLGRWRWRRRLLPSHRGHATSLEMVQDADCLNHGGLLERGRYYCKWGPASLSPMARGCGPVFPLASRGAQSVCDESKIQNGVAERAPVGQCVGRHQPMTGGNLRTTCRRFQHLPMLVKWQS